MSTPLPPPAPPRRAPRRRSRIAGVLVAGALLAGLAGCGGDDDEDAAAGGTRDVTVMLNWSPNTQHIGLYVALQRGWFAEAGYDVHVLEPGAGATAEDAVDAGRAQLGLSVAEGLLPARASGRDIVSVAAVLPVNDSSLMALTSSGIDRPADLAGKVYGGYGGPLEEELISTLVACDGGDPEAVRQVEVGDADYLAGMEQGRFDVVWVFDGWDVQRAQLAGAEVTTIDFADWADCIPNWYTPVYIADEQVVAEEPDLIAGLLEVIARGYDAAAEDPAAAAADFEAAVPEADPALVEASAAYYADRWHARDTPWGHQEEATWREFATFLEQAGALDGEVDPAGAFTNDLLPER